MSSGVALRALHDGDAVWIAREIVRPAVHRWLTGVPHPYRLEDAEAFFARYRSDPFYRVIEQAGAPRGIVSIDRGTARPELGYWLEEPAWGRGLMTTAASMVIVRFTRASRAALASGWIEGNHASAHVLAKLGFVPTGQVVQTYSHFVGRKLPVMRAQLDRAHRTQVERKQDVTTPGRTGFERDAT
ncbi:GNAT family N-acetyltransferase [Marivita sp. GX14005]|uniref:GNAT family N-acetyltransferase n=1 Tax=Marivita sp. GX14005 TaxID=2942276 RepID=UPI00201927D5|nr:GNAT family N-acetyltransferase [Marivita sp. GX14005]MCL3882574.1 GNAT family N-acetyltransferase [Marivita sp. GX14005]